MGQGETRWVQRCTLDAKASLARVVRVAFHRLGAVQGSVLMCLAGRAEEVSVCRYNVEPHGRWMLARASRKIRKIA